MRKEHKERLSLDRPSTYQIEVPRLVAVNRAGWAAEMAITVEDQGDPITSLTDHLDQAALNGLLRRLYSTGLPLISAVWLEAGFS